MPASAEIGSASAPSFLMGQAYTCVSDDANCHAGNLQGWSQLYDQMSAGAFQGVIQGAFFDSFHIFREHTNVRLRQSCMVRSDAWWFGIPACDRTAFRLDARSIGDGAIAVRRGQQSFELVTPQSFEVFGVVVQRDALERHLQAAGGTPLLPHNCDMLSATVAVRAQLRNLVQGLLAELQQRPELLQSDAARKSMESSVLEALAAACLQRGEHDDPGRTALQRALLVRDVRQYLLQLDERLVSVPELCEHFAVSRRHLQYAFEDVMGMGPNAYLKLLRLNGVRRALSRSGGLQVSVNQVAADWGFWHLSQFAKDYRQHFHELPSATLRRAQGTSLSVHTR